MLAALCLFLPGCGEDEAIPANVKEAIEAGWTFFAVSEFDRSEAAFTSAAAKAQPGSREYLLARFGLANAYHHRKPTPKLDDAQGVYEGLAVQDKGGEIGGWSALAVARIGHMKLYDVDRPGSVAQSTTGEYLFVVIVLVAVALGVGAAYFLKDKYRLAGMVVMVAALIGGIKLASWARTKATAAGGTEKAVANLPQDEELAEARKRYQRVMDEFPKTPAAQEAAVFYGETMIELLTPDKVKQGIEYLRKWLAEHPESTYIGAAYSQIANGYEMLGLPKEQLQAMIKSDDSNTDPLADHSWWYYRIAGIADSRASEPEIAKKYYKLMLLMYPTDFRVFLCKRALKRLEGGAKAGALGPSRDREGANVDRLLTRAARLPPAGARGSETEAATR
ncbi:MAG: tetratricopeptide repeat protein [Planctomycetota bacterium]|nr:tetratricopeptide repeat protein [Planctomycetota bacterium]